MALLLPGLKICPSPGTPYLPKKGTLGNYQSASAFVLEFFTSELPGQLNRVD